MDTVSYEDASSAVTVDLATSTNNTGDALGDTYVDIENVRGSDFNDRLTGDNNDNVLEGGVGDDLINGAVGSDTVSYVNATTGGTVDLSRGTANIEGNDTLTAVENVLGSGFSDTFIANAEVNFFGGGNGIDTVSYENSKTVIVDFLSPSNNIREAAGDTYANIENIRGSEFSDFLKGDNNDNLLEGLDGDDSLVGNGGNDTLRGGEGDDRLIGGAGADVLDGGAGVDTVYYGLDSVQVDLSNLVANTGDALGDTYSDVEVIRGSLSADTLRGDSAANIFYGEQGDDKLYGKAGTDDLYGEAGDDTLEGGADADRLDGGDDNDTASYASSSSGVTVSLVFGTVGLGGDAQGDTLSNIEHLTGSDHSDTLIGDSGDNALKGGADDDYLEGGLGADAFDGGSVAKF